MVEHVRLAEFLEPPANSRRRTLREKVLELSLGNIRIDWEFDCEIPTVKGSIDSVDV
jgi:hypothetical protein